MTKHPRIRALVQATCKTDNLRELFSEVDTDDSMDLTLEEFARFVEGVRVRADAADAAGVDAREIEATFRFIDDDHSGSVDRDELWLKPGSNKAKTRLKTMLKCLSQLMNIKIF